MHTPPGANPVPSPSVRLPHWMALLGLPVLFVLVHGALPWALSLLSTRHGWRHGYPRRRHLLALLLVAAGTAGISWCARLYFRASASFELQPTQRFLLVDGPYAFTRNPMYLSVLVIWLGWALFYGSVAVCIGLMSIWVLARWLVIPWEERKLEARFGEVYVRYKNRVPRWFGKIHR